MKLLKNRSINIVIGTLGNFSASIGKAKNKKTFNVSAIVAAALKNGAVLRYVAELPDGKRKGALCRYGTKSLSLSESHETHFADGWLTERNDFIIEKQKAELHQKIAKRDKSIDDLKVQMQHMQEQHDKQIRNLQGIHNQELEAKDKEISRLNTILEKAFNWFPLLKEMLRMEKLCYAIGFTKDMINSLLTKRKLSDAMEKSIPKSIDENLKSKMIFSKLRKVRLIIINWCLQ